MKKIMIFGNSGSGKSTLAKEYADKFGLAHLDLDSLAWKDTSPPERRNVQSSLKDILTFTDKNDTWVIEGCYADLLSLISIHATNMIFINPDVETCIANCKNRPWEPHKYPSKQAQDENLEMLIDWIKQYPVREDEFSLKAHRELFYQYEGEKIEYNCNQRLELI